MSFNKLHQTNAKKSKQIRTGLYEPLSFFAFRAPLLPIEDYLALSTDSAAIDRNIHALIDRDPRIKRALMVGSPSLYRAWEKGDPVEQLDEKVRSKLLRFLIRMSSRPTPYGSFAGVAIGRWSEESDLALADELPKIRTRLDMDLVTKLALKMEPKVLRNLTLRTNPTVLFFAEQVYLAEKSPGLDEKDIDGAAIPATKEICAVLAAAQIPISYAKLLRSVCRVSIEDKDIAQQLIEELVEHTFLLTDMRPSMFDPNAAATLAAKLRDLPESKSEGETLATIVQSLNAFDCSANGDGQHLPDSHVDNIKSIIDTKSDVHFQTDMEVILSGKTLHKAVASETSKMVDLLWELNDAEFGHSHLTAYRQRFYDRYGEREVPLLELISNDAGLGLPDEREQPALYSADKNQRLCNELICSAICDKKLEVELTPSMVAQFAPDKRKPWAKLPLSLDMFVTLIAKSVQDIDEGNFLLAGIGPHNGAGRNLGRFADVIGSDVVSAMQEVCAAEKKLEPDKIFAELAYLPRNMRLANICIRPIARDYQIVMDSWTQSSNHELIALSDLVVGISDNFFYVRSPARKAKVIITAGHLLQPIGAPGLARFLTHLSQDGVLNIHGFSWGTAAQAPFLPRIRHGKFIISLAQWSIHKSADKQTEFDDRHIFDEWIDAWRRRWFVPRHVYLTQYDNRLLLDLQDQSQREELRIELLHKKKGETVFLQESFCQLDQLWAHGAAGHFVSELVVPLVRAREQELPQNSHAELSDDIGAAVKDDWINPSFLPQTVSTKQRLRAPGSEWLFVKLYGGNELEDELISSVLLKFASQAISNKLIKSWFFIRYGDPERHIRFRVRGNARTLNTVLYPKLCALGQRLIDSKHCSKFVIDTYDREIERYGGLESIELAERLFAIDSNFVANILKLEMKESLGHERKDLAVYTVDTLLRSLGLNEKDRIDWFKAYAEELRAESGPQYRKRKDPLLRLFSGRTGVITAPLQAVLDEWAHGIEAIGRQYEKINKTATLTRKLPAIYRDLVHMHCNRLLGTSPPQEREIFAMALRVRAALSAQEMS
ncbi:lantibiotic dehydratase [soil metagenome]